MYTHWCPSLQITEVLLKPKFPYRLVIKTKQNVKFVTPMLPCLGWLYMNAPCMRPLTLFCSNVPQPPKGSGGIEKSHSCKWAKWIQWHALPHIQQSTQQRNKGHYPNLHGWDFSIPPSPSKDIKASIVESSSWWGAFLLCPSLSSVVRRSSLAAFTVQRSHTKVRIEYRSRLTNTIETNILAHYKTSTN